MFLSSTLIRLGIPRGQFIWGIWMHCCCLRNQCNIMTPQTRKKNYLLFSDRKLPAAAMRSFKRKLAWKEGKYRLLGQMEQLIDLCGKGKQETGEADTWSFKKVFVKHEAKRINISTKKKKGTYINRNWSFILCIHKSHQIIFVVAL